MSNAGGRSDSHDESKQGPTAVRGDESTLRPSGTESTLGAAIRSGPSTSAPRMAADDTVPDGIPLPDYPELLKTDLTHYVPSGEIARGGMGRIVRARDRRLRRDVAIKELLLGGGDIDARFEREALLTARLQHPSIVSVYEAGRRPTGEPFYAMKLIEGRPVDAVVAATESLAKRVALLPNVLAVFDAMAYAHQQRVIHRDLKPGNIIVGEYGETVVVDWGLAKDLSDAQDTDERASKPYRVTVAGQTIDGSIMGTPSFMPPEQADGRPVDERADVYALGAILYYVLSGRPPHSGPSVEGVLAAVRLGPPVPISEREPAVPADLVAIVEKAMRREPSDRYPTARLLADDLRRFTSGQLVGAHRYTAWQLVQRWIARHRGAVGVGAVATVLLLVGGGVAIRRIVAARNLAQVAARRSELGRLVAEARTLFETDPGGAALNLSAAFRLAPADASVERAARDWHRRTTERTLGGFFNAVNDVAWSRDGRWVGVASGEPSVRIWDTQSWWTVVELRPAAGGPVTALAFSPDGASVAVGQQSGQLSMWRRAGGAQLWSNSILRAAVRTIDWSRDGRSAFAVGIDGVLVRMGAAVGDAIPPPEDFSDGRAGLSPGCPTSAWACPHVGGMPTLFSGRLWDVSVDPSGEWVAYVSPNPMAAFVEFLPLGSRRRVRLQMDNTPQAATWINTGELAVGFNTGAVRAYFPVPETPGRPVFVVPGSVLRLRARGESIAAGTEEGGVYVRRVFDGIGEPGMETGAGVDGLALDPEGARVVAVSRNLRFARVTRWVRPSSLLTGSPSDAMSQIVGSLRSSGVAPSRAQLATDLLASIQDAVLNVSRQPHGDRIALIGFDHRLSLATIGSPSTRSACADLGGPANIAWSNDGRWLAAIRHDRTLVIWAVGSGCTEELRAPNAAFPDYMRWRPGASELLVSDAASHLALYRRSSAGWQRLAGPDVGAGRSAGVAVWSADGSSVFGWSASQNPGDIAWYLWDGRSARNLGRGLMAERMQPDPRGDRVAASARGSIALVEIRSGHSLWTTPMPPGRETIVQMMWSDDGARLFVLDATGTMVTFDAADGAIRAAEQLGLRSASDMFRGRSELVVAGITAARPVLAPFRAAPVSSLRAEVDDFAIGVGAAIPSDFPARAEWSGVIGVEYEPTLGGARLTLVRPGGPAARAGLRAGDVLIAADGIDLDGMSDTMIAARLLGRPGSWVALSVRRGSAQHRIVGVRRGDSAVVYR